MATASIDRRLTDLRARAVALQPADEGVEPLGLAEFIEEVFIPEVVTVKRPDKVAQTIPHFGHWCDLVEGHRLAGIVAFRASMKSVFAKGVVTHALRNHTAGSFDVAYISSSFTLAREHVADQKQFLSELADSWGWMDTTESDHLIRYKRPGATFKVRPITPDSRVRGLRFDFQVWDDVLDPAKPLSMSDVDRCINALERRLLPMVKSSRSRILFLGTPICPGDVIEWIESNPMFATTWLPIIDEDGNPTWPELFGLERIEELRQSTQRGWDSEYLLRPTNLSDSFISPALLQSAVFTGGDEEGIDA